MYVFKYRETPCLSVYSSCSCLHNFLFPVHSLPFQTNLATYVRSLSFASKFLLKNDSSPRGCIYYKKNCDMNSGSIKNVKFNVTETKKNWLNIKQEKHQ